MTNLVLVIVQISFQLVRLLRQDRKGLFPLLHLLLQIVVFILERIRLSDGLGRCLFSLFDKKLSVLVVGLKCVIFLRQFVQVVLFGLKLLLQLRVLGSNICYLIGKTRIGSLTVENILLKRTDIAFKTENFGPHAVCLIRLRSNLLGTPPKTVNGGVQFVHLCAFEVKLVAKLVDLFLELAQLLSERKSLLDCTFVILFVIQAVLLDCV